MIVKIDTEKCIGCGLCASICPAVFEIKDDGKSHIKNPKGKCNLKEAADSCPVQAILLK